MDEELQRALRTIQRSGQVVEAIEALFDTLLPLKSGASAAERNRSTKIVVHALFAKLSEEDQADSFYGGSIGAAAERIARLQDNGYCRVCGDMIVWGYVQRNHDRRLQALRVCAECGAETQSPTGVCTSCRSHG